MVLINVLRKLKYSALLLLTFSDRELPLGTSG